MKNIYKVTSAVLLALTCYFSLQINSEYVKFHPCSYNSTVNCSISDVFVDPCPEAEEDDPCLFYYGTKASISFNFTPRFNSKQLTARAYSVTFLTDLPFIGMDTNACNYTTCPSYANQSSSYNYGVDIINAYPQGPYTVKWRLWNEINQECCFLIKIKIL